MVDAILQFIRNRISSLRIKKNVSEYRMSMDLGHSKSYVQSISSGKALPSMTEFAYICDYFGISPKEFFDEEVEEPILVRRLYMLSRDMPKEDLEALIAVAERWKTKK